MESSKQKKDLLAVLAGIFLIALVGAFALFDPDAQKNNPPSKSSPGEEKTESLLQKTISPEEMAEKTKSESSWELLDLRSREEFESEHILDSKNIPLEAITSELNLLDKNNSYILFDALGNPELQTKVSRYLKEGDFSDFFFLEGGFKAWKSRGLPTVSGGNPASFSDQAKANYISSADLKKSLENKEAVLIVDLRNSADFSKEKIAGSINIPLQDLEKRRKELPMGYRIVLCDKDGLWAFRGAVRLFDSGIANTLILSDGLEGWKKNGFELEQKKEGN